MLFDDKCNSVKIYVEVKSMETFECILKRRSIRHFLDKEVEDEDIKKILEAAMAAPSAINKQPWEFYVIKNKDLMAKLKSTSPYFDKNSPLIIVVCGNRTGETSKFTNDFWIQDCSAAIENMLLTATDLGLGSLWCGVYPRYDRYTKVREILKLDRSIIPLGIIHFGYPEKEKEPRTQYSEDKVHIIE